MELRSSWASVRLGTLGRAAILDESSGIPVRLAIHTTARKDPPICHHHTSSERTHVPRLPSWHRIVLLELRNRWARIVRPFLQLSPSSIAKTRQTRTHPFQRKARAAPLLLGEHCST